MFGANVLLDEDMLLMSVDEDMLDDEDDSEDEDFGDDDMDFEEEE